MLPSLGVRRIYLRACPNDFRASPSIAGLPHHAGLVSGFCSSSPSLWHRLPSDSASRRTPLPSLAVPVITARRGLTPPGSKTCLARKERDPSSLGEDGSPVVPKRNVCYTNNSFTASPLSIILMGRPRGPAFSLRALIANAL